MITKRYQFAHTIIEISLPEELPIPDNMSMFEIGCGPEKAEEADRQQAVPGAAQPHKRIELEIVDDLAPMRDAFCEKHPNATQIVRKNLCVLTDGEAECRLIAIEGAEAPYAVYVEECAELTRTRVHRDIVGLMKTDTVFGSLLGLEKVMMRHGGMILHSAYMCRNGKAVLFSAPSETGKSTQARLWEEYRGTRQINGDRSLLIREEDGWYAYGWPLCGSSEICHNEAYPIEAIVMLYQAKENEVKRLGAGPAMKKVMSQIMINMWNSEFQMQAMDRIQQLVMEVPVFELGCNISEDAVACLEGVLN